ncbi:hypothetical protein [Segatella baroniae]|nr:hypothetical protein [Segatella baroniae]
MLNLSKRQGKRRQTFRNLGNKSVLLASIIIHSLILPPLGGSG